MGAVVHLGRADSARLAAWHAASFARPWTAAAFTRLLAGKGVVGLGLPAPTSAALVAAILLRHVADEAEILTFATAPAHRRCGRGRFLLAAARQYARDAGARRLHLEVSAANIAARALYRAQAFRETGRRADYYPTGDAVMMQCEV